MEPITHALGFHYPLSYLLLDSITSYITLQLLFSDVYKLQVFCFYSPHFLQFYATIHVFPVLNYDIYFINVYK
jgi:hypothetical protein